MTPDAIAWLIYVGVGLIIFTGALLVLERRDKHAGRKHS
jgi:hypothetical protein